MAVDHARPLPVAPERLEHLAQEFWGKPLAEVPHFTRLEITKIALMEAQLESTRNVEFFLNEAYDIYNARFR